MAQASPYYKVENGSRVFGSLEGLLQFIKTLLQQKGKVFEVKQTQGKLVPYHCHNHQEVIVVVEGSMRMIIEEDIVELQTGDFVVIEPWAIHLACFPREDVRFYLCFPLDKQRFQF